MVGARQHWESSRNCLDRQDQPLPFTESVIDLERLVWRSRVEKDSLLLIFGKSLGSESSIFVRSLVEKEKGVFDFFLNT